MSEFLQRGTAEIPTFNASGAAMSPELSRRVHKMVNGIEHLPLYVEMHPDVAAAWNNCPISVSDAVAAQIGKTVGISFQPKSQPITFAGFPVKQSVDYPRNEINVMFDSKCRNSDNKLAGPHTVARIVNIGLSPAA